jgi:hypothetical protein
MPFSRRDKQRIARVTSEAEKRLMSSGVRTRNRPQTNYASYIVKTPSGGIPARSGTTLGSATCTVQNVSTTTISDGISETVLNLSDTAIAGSTYVMATRDRQGNYIAEALGSSGQQNSYVYWGGSYTGGIDGSPPGGGTTVSKTTFSGAEIFNADSSDPDFSDSSGTITANTDCFMFAMLHVTWTYGASWQIGTSPVYAVPANIVGTMTLDGVNFVGSGGASVNDFNSGCFYFGATTPTTETFDGDQTWNVHGWVEADETLGVNFQTKPQTGAAANGALTQTLGSISANLTILAVAK